MIAKKILEEALREAIDKRDLSSRMIKSYTLDWIEAQKKIIDLQKTLEEM